MHMLPRTKCGNSILRKKAQKVPLKSIKTPKIQNLIKQMFYTMRRTHGVGLAAPQIGESLQIAVIEVKENPQYKKILPLKKTVIINTIQFNQTSLLF